MSIKGKIESLISAGNTTTGEADTDLTSVVQSLVNGYGQGGGDVTIESLSVTENGTYTAPTGKAYTPVTVAVPQPSGTKSVSITSNGTTTEDVENYADAEITVNVPNTYTASDEGKVVNNGALTSQTSATYTENDTYDTTLIDEVTINVDTVNNQDKTVVPSESVQSITADDGYTGLGEVTVDGIPTNYVGSAVPRKASADLTVSGATVNVPSGYYSASASKAVASGAEGTPTATKGTVANHSVDVTPSVTNTEGYIQGGTKNGSAVKVSASELVSGTLEIDSSGTKDVTNYKNVSVPSGTEGTPTATKGAVSNHAVDVTPSVTNTEGYIAGGTKSGTAVKVSASELVSGTKAITSNGTEDVTNYASVNVAVPNSYDASDEGKVVSNGALVSQSSATYITNDTYDTTLINSVTVNVPSGGGGISVDDIAQNLAPSGAVVLGDDVTNIDTGAFYGKPITSIKGDGVAKINSNAFSNCTNLTNIDFPNVTTIASYAFENCGFSDVIFPKLKSLNYVSYAFNGTGLNGACVMPLLTTTNGAQTFRMARFNKIDLGAVTSIPNNFFNNASVKVLILRKTDAITTLVNVSTFTATPFASNGTGGTLYVPSALISSYQSATNWSTILGYANNQILPIEGSIYETQYADGTPIS